MEQRSTAGNRRVGQSNGASAGSALATPPVWHKVAGGLGWFSIGLGLTELLAPRALARSIGAPPRAELIRAMGLREIMAGLGILLGRNTGMWVQSRVAGDMIDLALLGAAYRARRAKRTNLTAATAAVAGVTALDVLCSARLAQTAPLVIAKSVAVMRPADELYAYWRNLENLPRVMSHIESVKQNDDKRSHWVAKGPAGKTLEWDALITEEVPGKKLAWRSAAGAIVENRGEVEFLPLAAGHGTAVKLTLEFNPPGGRLATALGKLFSMIPETQVGQDLRRFKQLLETGEIATTQGQPSGRRSPLSRILP